MEKRWNNYTDYLISRYGMRVYKVGVDAAFSCPNRDSSKRGGCSFCDGTGAIPAYLRQSESGFTRSSSYSEEVSGSILERKESIHNQIERGIEFVKRRYNAEGIALFFESWTNTYDSVDNLKRIYDEALSEYNFVSFIVSTRPDCVSDEVLSLLSSYNNDNRDVWVELGLQSGNDNTLSLINRGHNTECFLGAAKRVKEHGLMLTTHIILGLPGEDKEDYLHTIDVVNTSGSDAIKIHSLHITGGTKMEEWFKEGECITESSERHLEDTELCLRHLNPSITIERLLSDTPMHRLLSPRYFMDKSLFIKTLDERMREHNTRQGDLYKGS